MSDKKTLIMEYMDYRLYLSDFIETRKLENPSYSMRAFAARLECNPGQFNRILKGERNLTPSHVVEIGNIVKFTRKEKRYFEILVSFNHAKKQSEREYYFDQMQQFRKANIKEITCDQYLIYSHWYYLVLRELLAIYPCIDISDSECRKMGKMLNPAVSSNEVRVALEILLRLGVIEKKDDGCYRAADAFTASGCDVPQVITNRFLLEFNDLAQRSVDNIPRNERRLSTLTFSISQNNYLKISERIDEFRRELLGMVASDDGDLDNVYHLNLHFFPVTKADKEHF